MLLTTQISNHGVRKFWIYWTLCLLSCLWNYMEHFLVLDASPLFLSNKGGNWWTIEQLVKLVDFMEYSRYFQDLPKPRNQSHANSETKKV